MPGPTLAGKVILDDSQAAAALRRVEAIGAAAAAKLQSTMGGALRSFTSPIAALGPAIAGAFAGQAIARGVANVFDAGRALRVLQRETGAGAAGLVILQSKFKQAGLDGDMVGRAIFRLQKSISGLEDDENKGGAGRLQQLGLSLAALQKMAPDKQLMAVGAAISTIQDPAARTGAAMQIFGKAGAEMGAVFNGPGFTQIAPGLQQKAEMMARNAALFEQVSIKLERVGNVLKTFYVGVADRVATTLSPILDRLEKINLVSLGQKFGDGLVKGAQAFVGAFANPGLLADALFFRLAANGATFGNQLIATFKYAGESLLAAFRASPAILSRVGEGVGFTLLAAAEKFAAAGINAGVKISEVVKAGIDWVSTHGVSNLGTRLIAAAAGFAAAMANAVINPAAAVAGLVGGVAAQAKQNVANDTAETLGFALSSAANGKGFDVAGGLNKSAGENAGRAGSAFSQAAALAGTALASPTFKVDDILGAGAMQTRAAQAFEAMRRSGAATIGTSPTAPGTNPAKSGPSPLQLAQAHMALVTSHAPVGADPAAYMFQPDNVVHNTAWGRTNATDLYTARVDAARRLDMSNSHTIGIGGALDFDPSTRPGWTGASNFGSNFTKADWKTTAARAVGFLQTAQA